MNLLFDIGYALSRFTGAVLMGGSAKGKEFLPRTGGFILASNHISNLDPPLVGCFVPRRTHFFAKKELFDVPILGWIVKQTNSHPVRRGAVDRNAVKTAVQVIKDGHPLVVFPEGTRALHGDFLEPKAGIGMIARAAESSIVPCYIQGSNDFKKCFFRRDRLHVQYGSPVTSEWVKEQPNNKDGWMKIAHEIMGRIRSLRDSSLSRKSISDVSESRSAEGDATGDSINKLEMRTNT